MLVTSALVGGFFSCAYFTFFGFALSVCRFARFRFGVLMRISFGFATLRGLGGLTAVLLSLMFLRLLLWFDAMNLVICFCNDFGFFFVRESLVARRLLLEVFQLIDGIICIGGGIMNNSEYIMPGILNSMRGTIRTMSGDVIGRVQSKVYNLDDPEEFAQFASGDAREIKVYGSDRTVTYDPQKRIGVMKSRIGASKAISIGAYTFALSQLDK